MIHRWSVFIQNWLIQKLYLRSVISIYYKFQFATNKNSTLKLSEIDIDHHKNALSCTCANPFADSFYTVLLLQAQLSCFSFERVLGLLRKPLIPPEFVVRTRC